MLLLPTVVGASHAQTTDQQDLPLLEPSQPIKRKINGGESQYYRIALMTDQYVQIAVDQRGIDVRVKLFRPDGTVVAQSNRLAGSYGPEMIWWVAENAGFYKLEVQSIQKDQHADFYELELLAEHVATVQERNRIAPQRVFMEAERLREENKPDQAIAKYEEALQVARDVGDLQWEAETLNVLGLVYDQLKSDKQNARQRFEKALQIRQSSGDRRGEAETLNNLGRIYENLRQYPAALEYYERSLQPWQDAGDRYGEAWALFNIGRVHYRSQAPQRALEYQYHALKIWGKVEDVSRQAATLHSIGESQALLGNYSTALNTFDEACEKWRAASDLYGKAQTLFAISKVYGKLGNTQKQSEFNALGEDLRRRADAGRVPTPENQAKWDRIQQAEKAQAEARKLLSGTKADQAKAVEQYEEAVRIFDSIAEYEREVFALFDISSTYKLLADKDKERETLERALSVGKRVHSTTLQAESLKRLAEFHSTNGDDAQRAAQRAVDYYDAAIEIWHRQGDRSSEAYLLSITAKVYNTLGNKEKPGVYLNQALRLYHDLGDRFREAYILNDLAKLSDDKQAAVDYLKRARDLRRANHDRAGEAESLKQIIAFYVSMGQKTNALDYYHQVLAVYRQSGDGMGEAEILRDLMTYWTEQKQATAAIFYGKQAINTYQAIRRNIQDLGKQTQKSFIDSKEDIYRQLADLLISEGRLPEAEQILNMLKIEEFNNFIRGSKDKDPPNSKPADLTPAEAAQYEEYRQYTAQTTAISNEHEKLFAKDNKSDAENARMDELDRQINIANGHYFNYLKNLATVFLEPKQENTIKNIKGLMSSRTMPGSLVLYVLFVNDRYRVIVFTPGTAKVARQYPIKEAELNKKIIDLRLALKDPTSDPRQAAKELYNIVIGPIADDLKNFDAKTLMWSLDGNLRYVPIAALYDGEKYMVERYHNEVFTASSVSRMDHPSTNNWRGLGFGVSNPSEGAPLPAVVDELKGIFRNEDDPNATGGTFPGKILLNEEFTKDAMVRALRLRRYSLVHIASHFNLNPGYGLESYLVLGKGKLTVKDIMDMSGIFSGIELLTLSACNTAVDDGAGGNGAAVDNFGELAQQQGADAVIGSLWSVADPSTAIFMQKFYQFRTQNSQASISKAAALQETQLAFLHKQVTAPGNKDYAHPYYWAPFILIGNWR
jgi:CHAT domain-containing protein